MIDDAERRQGKCYRCLGRNERSCIGTRWVLNASADKRYRMTRAA